MKKRNRQLLMLFLSNIFMGNICIQKEITRVIRWL